MLRERITGSVEELGRRLLGVLWPLYARVVCQRLAAMSDDELRDVARFVRGEVDTWGDLW